MNTDQFMTRVYDREKYNCLHFASEVGTTLFGVNLREHWDSLLVGAIKARKLGRHHRSGFKRLAGPQSPCVVVFRHPLMTPHVGIFLNGKVLHLTPRGVQFMPLSVAGCAFNSQSFYELPCK